MPKKKPAKKEPAKKEPAKKKGKDELVVAPGGRRLKSQIHEVKPSEAVERKDDGSYVVTKRGGAPAVRDARPLDPDALVLTPGGYKRRAQVHQIESGHILDGNQGRFRMIDPFTRKAVDLGEVVVRKQGEPLMPLHVRRKTALRATSAVAPGAPTPVLGEGWITYAGWSNATGQPISFFTTTWVVPPPPARRSGQTIFLFNGIQNASMIYQPVLQWGPSAAGGSEYWAVACWYADGQTGQSFHSPLMRVSAGDVLVGNMALTGRQAATFGDTSPESPALASLSGRLYLAWKGDGNNNLNVMSSTDNGATFGNKHTSPERSPDAPSLCMNNGILFIAWKGDGNNNLNVARVGLAGNAITGITNKVTLGDTSPKTPSLASAGGRLYLAWRGDGNTNLNVISSDDNGATFGNKHTSPERSTEGPALCAHGGLLFIAWKGDGNNNLNVARVGLAGNAITGITDKVVLGDTSPEAPSLATAGGRLCLGWKGDGNNFLNVMFSTDNGASFGNKHTSPETSPRAPGLAEHGGNVFVTWKGDGNNNLNVAQVMLQNGRIVGLFGAGTNMFNYDSEFVGIGATRLAIRNVQELTWANETLEAYDVQEQLNYPATLRTEMRSIEIRTLGGNLALNWTANNAITDTGQHTGIASNANPGGEVDLYYYGSALVRKTTLGDTSPRTPPISSLGGRLYIAWKGKGNNNLNVMSSGDNGVTFGNKHTSGETSPEAPSLCVHNGNLFIAWKGTGNDNLNVARVGLAGNVITGITNKATLGDTSPVTPALASVGGRLYLAWKGKGNTNLNVMSSSDNGATFGNKHTSPERSTDGPALCAHAGALMIAWKGDGNNNLNVARVGLAGNAITGITNKVVLGDTSPLSPALASLAGRLWLGWKGNGNDFLNVMSSADGGATFGNKHTSWETSSRGPGLAAYAGLLFVSWNGVGNDQLNVAHLGS